LKFFCGSEQFFAKQLEESCEHFFEPFENVGKMIGAPSENVIRLLSVFLFL
jgi:hypothetical protein|tara:strand:+ start:69 stop:221 length:153 start_codon:yes stop_codon:yes gene_type:complete